MGPRDWNAALDEYIARDDHSCLVINGDAPYEYNGQFKKDIAKLQAILAKHKPSILMLSSLNLYDYQIAAILTTIKEKKIHVEHLDLAWNNLGEKSIAVLISLIMEGFPINTLVLHHNAIDTRSAVKLLRAVDENQHLKLIAMDNNPYEQDVTQELQGALGNFQMHAAKINLLQQLKLYAEAHDKEWRFTGTAELKSCPLSDKDIIYIARCILTFKPVLLELSGLQLRGNKLKLLLDELRQCSALSTLLLLNNHLDHQDAKLVAQFIKSNPPLRRLSLQYNNIDNAGASEIAISLIANDTLCSLNLMHNQFTIAILDDFARGLKDNYRLIKLFLFNEHAKQYHIELIDCLQRNSLLKSTKCENLKLLSRFSPVTARFVPAAATQQSAKTLPRK